MASAELPADTRYARLVGLIGAPQVTVSIGLVDVETIREVTRYTPTSGARSDVNRLVRELDHRVGAAQAAAVAVGADNPDDIRVPLTSDEIEEVRGAVETTRRDRYRGDSRRTPPAHTALLIMLDRRRGAVQYREATPHDPGE